MVASDMNTLMHLEPRTRVNSATLPQQNGRPIVLLGTVKQIDPTQQMIKVEASDGQIVLVKLQEPLQENLEGIVEFHGVGQGRQILANYYVSFPDSSMLDFDMNMYNEAMKMIHSLRESPWHFD